MTYKYRKWKKQKNNNSNEIQRLSPIVEEDRLLDNDASESKPDYTDTATRHYLVYDMESQEDTVYTEYRHYATQAKHPPDGVSVVLGSIFICLIIIFVIVRSMMMEISAQVMHDFFHRQVIPLSLIKTWNYSHLTHHLHQVLNEPVLQYSQWKRLVSASYAPLGILNTSAFTYIEAGSGLGAWSLEFLTTFPHAKGHAVESDADMVNISQWVLRDFNISHHHTDMANIPNVLAHQMVDYIFFPASMCYMQSQGEIYWLLNAIYRNRVIKPVTGKIGIIMQPLEDSYMGNCITRVSSKLWENFPLAYSLLSIQSISQWNISEKLNHMNQFAIFLNAV